MLVDHLVLAGGGHTHALMLLRWAKNPHQRPKGLITLINRDSTTIYSAMVPGVISGDYSLQDVSINLRRLAEMAGVVIVIAEINGLNIDKRILYLNQRPNIRFSGISFDVGSETNIKKLNHRLLGKDYAVSIKPFDQAIKWIQFQDSEACLINAKTFTVIGGGFAGLEVVFALRKRWPKRPLQLQTSIDKLKKSFRYFLSIANISLVDRETLISGPALVCTGSKSPEWLAKSGLEVDHLGRVRTLPTLQSIKYNHIFAVGDCGVIDKFSRPPSGVWAVRATNPLSENLKRLGKGRNLIFWRPQRNCLQLIGGPHKLNINLAWACWGGLIIGPNVYLWKLKKLIDKKFIEMLNEISLMRDMKNGSQENYACRGCAAKIAANPLRSALRKADLKRLAHQPEDAACISNFLSDSNLIQSVDGFPALISDPWLNARLTTLHACSDIWATGGFVISAQPIITIPSISEFLQEELLTQVLSGIKSALEDQDANIIGGHTMESRSLPPSIITKGIEIAISVNGIVPVGQKPLRKNGLQPGDVILLSRPLGSGVFFAAAMKGEANSLELDFVINQLNKSQHFLLNNILTIKDQSVDSELFHACTDITGFGLLGHLSEMLFSSNAKRFECGLRPLRIKLLADKIPSYPGVLDLFSNGHESTLAPANRRFWSLFESNGSDNPFFVWDLENIKIESEGFKQILELVIDPQTCGPLAISCSPDTSKKLVENGCWTQIGSVILI